MGEFLQSYGIIIAVVILLVIIILTGYVKAPPNMAYILSGLKKTPRVLIGRAGVKLPILERLDKLYLGQMSVDIKTDTFIPTNDFINVKVDAVAKVRIRSDVEGLQLAAKNFLNKSSEEIAMDLMDSLQGNMREIIGTLDLKSINTDRDSFSDQVMEKASKDMDKLGIEIISCNIQNVTDENGLITDMGMDNTAKIKKDAAIAKAQADRDVAIAQAQADKESNEARVKAETEIAEKNNALDIKKSELQIQADIKRAEADAAYEIQNQEQQKTVQAATVNAQIAKAERERELKSQQVQVRQQELAAEIEKKADAERYRRQQEAEAQLIERQKQAEAEKFEQERKAEARKALAEAERFAAEQEAAGIAAKYNAEAEGIRAKGLAEAEAMERKAEAYRKYNGAAIVEMFTKIMPEMASEIAKPLSSIDKINIYGGGEAGASQISGNIPVVMKQVMDTMSEVTGVDMSEIVKASTYEAKVTKNINVDGLPQEVVKTEAPQPQDEE